MNIAKKVISEVKWVLEKPLTRKFRQEKEVKIKSTIYKHENKNCR